MSPTRNLLLSLFCVPVCLLYGQAGSPRLSDRDVERLMKNVEEDAKRFSSSFKKAVEKSSIRKTSREKEAKQLADRFANETKALAKDFDRTKKADKSLPVVYQSLNQLDGLMRELGLTGVAAADFQKVKTELGQVADQFSYTPPS